jgi:hypothetical protein
MSILIKTSPIRVKLRLVRGQTILIISKKLLLLSSGSLLRDHRLSRSRRRWRAGMLAREKIPKTKSTHVQTHARNPVTIVGAIEEHRASQHWDRALRSRRRTHGDGERARAATGSDGESVEEKREQFFFPTVVRPPKATTDVAAENANREAAVFFTPK